MAAQRLLEERLKRPARPLGLATGRTMEPVYRAMTQRFEKLAPLLRHEIRARWLSFNLDEYVGLDRLDPRSFSSTMATQLVRPLGLDPARVHLPDGGAPDPEREARRYGTQIRRLGGIGLQLLGLGLNGHVGFNEPPCDHQSRCRSVALSETTRRQNADAFGGDPALVPEHAITLGLSEILASQRILLVVTGAAKARVLHKVLQEPPTPTVPASWLQHHPGVTVVADMAALGKA